MITKDLTQNALNRLLAINWRIDDYKINSHVALFQEYLRRMALWAKATDSTDLFPFFDVTTQLFPSIATPQEQVNILMQHLAKFRLGKNVKQTCEWYLYWSMVAKNTAIKELELPPPYEPLILMYERGGTFYTEHGFFCVSVASFPRKNWSSYVSLTPIVKLESSALDMLDSSNISI